MSKVKDVFKKKSLVLLFLQGFFGVFPWNTIIAFIFIYLSEERGYLESEVLMTMAPAVIILALGYPIGGALGDHFFKKSKKGRVMVALTGVLTGALLLFITLNIPTSARLLFVIGLVQRPVHPCPTQCDFHVNDNVLPEIRTRQTISILSNPASALRLYRDLLIRCAQPNSQPPAQPSDHHHQRLDLFGIF
jgi:hypothetical protein